MPAAPPEEQLAKAEETVKRLRGENERLQTLYTDWVEWAEYKRAQILHDHFGGEDPGEAPEGFEGEDAAR